MTTARTALAGRCMRASSAGPPESPATRTPVPPATANGGERAGSAGGGGRRSIRDTAAVGSTRGSPRSAAGDGPGVGDALRDELRRLRQRQQLGLLRVGLGARLELDVPARQAL